MPILKVDKSIVRFLSQILFGQKLPKADIVIFKIVVSNFVGFVM